MYVSPLQRFDRESDFPGKRMGIPITVCDSKGMCATKTVYVIIGDDVSLNFEFFPTFITYFFKIMEFSRQ